jgi:hypothetical protein
MFYLGLWKLSQTQMLYQAYVRHAPTISGLSMFPSVSDCLYSNVIQQQLIRKPSTAHTVIPWKLEIYVKNHLLPHHASK